MTSKWAAVRGKVSAHGRPWILSLALLAMLATAFPSSAGASAARLSGFGDKMNVWAAAFPKHATGCIETVCYGPAVKNSTAKYEFSFVTTFRGRVDGFDLALRRGTPEVRAELQVAELFPGDIQMSSLNVIHKDMFGNGCAVYNLSSKTLLHLFGAKAFGGSRGTVGVELASVLPNGNTVFNPGNVDLVLVVPTYLGSDADC